MIAPIIRVTESVLLPKINSPKNLSFWVEVRELCYISNFFIYDSVCKLAISFKKLFPLFPGRKRLKCCSILFSGIPRRDFHFYVTPVTGWNWKIEIFLVLIF